MTCRTQAFRSAGVKRITVAGAPVLALRVTYVGELGWEPISRSRPTVYDVLMAARSTASPMQAIAPSSRCAGEGLPRLGS